MPRCLLYLTNPLAESPHNVLLDHSSRPAGGSIHGSAKMRRRLNNGAFRKRLICPDCALVAILRTRRWVPPRQNILNTAGALSLDIAVKPHIQSYYAASAHPAPERPALEGGVDCDVCVIGGGIAGCSTALHLAERGYRVVLLEGNRIGWGASGRSGAQ